MNKEFEDMVKKLRKSGDDVLASLNPEKADLWHMAFGIGGEAGEIIDAVKKSVIYNRTLDIENIKEELGDLLFYMEGIRQICGLSWDNILSHNMKKLSVRYPDYHYTDMKAHERADKK
jgi:NTP pyrophosphatase (non-canonical NTP hydrolase)